MGLSAYVGSFNLSTAAGGNTQEISDPGFEPKIVFFWWSGGHEDIDTVAGASYSYGFGAAVSSTSRWCVGGNSLDAQADSSSSRFNYTTACIHIYSSAGAVDGIMDFQSMDADGFTLIIDDSFSVDYRVHYLALGGTDLTNVFLGSNTAAVDAGNYNVTGVGFQPDAVILGSIGSTVTNGAPGSLTLSLGMATGSSNQGVATTHDRNAQATSDTYGYGYNGEILAPITSGSLGIRESFVGFIADGFTLNHLEGASAIYYYYACLKGGQYLASDLTTRTDGNDIAEDVGFQPAAVLFTSANRALSTQDTPTAHGRHSIGAGTAADNRACAAISAEDNLADTETAYTHQADAVYAHVVDDAIEALMDIKSIDSSGFTCVMDDAETAGCWVTYLAIGAAAVTTRTVSTSDSTGAAAEARTLATSGPQITIADTPAYRVPTIRIV